MTEKQLYTHEHMGTSKQARRYAMMREEKRIGRMTRILEKELGTYAQQRDALLGRAEGKWVLIHEQRVLGTYHCQMDAIAEDYRQLGSVPFLVKQIVRFERPEYILSPLLGV